MAWVPKEHIQWLESHGRRDETGWVCKSTGADINAIPVGRSIHIAGLLGGPGEVREVLHLYCTRCNPSYEAPSHGTPIQESALAIVSSGAAS